MPFRPRFDCLWCGQAWETRSPDDLEGWAALCPECLGQADENGFLRARLRTALRDRAAAAASAVTTSGSPNARRPALPRPSRRPATGRTGICAADPSPEGRSMTGPGRWSSTRSRTGSTGRASVARSSSWAPAWAGGPGCWPRRASCGSMTTTPLRWRQLGRGWWRTGCSRTSTSATCWPAPDKQVDAVFAAYLLGAARSRAELGARVSMVLRWLRPGGAFVFVEARAGEDEARPGRTGPGAPNVHTRVARRIVGRCRFRSRRDRPYPQLLRLRPSGRAGLESGHERYPNPDRPPWRVGPAVIPACARAAPLRGPHRRARLRRAVGRRRICARSLRPARGRGRGGRSDGPRYEHRQHLRS